MSFVWDDWNEDHIAKHGVGRAEAEYVVSHREPPFPRYVSDGKYLVRGPTARGRYLQVIYCFRSDDDLDYEAMSIEDIIAVSGEDVPAIYIVHARELEPSERRGLRKKR